MPRAHIYRCGSSDDLVVGARGVGCFCITASSFWIVWHRALATAQPSRKESAGCTNGGAEYLVHEQMMIGTKHDPLIPVSPSDLSESATLHLGTAEIRQINQPDEEPQKQLRDGTQEESGVDNE